MRAGMEYQRLKISETTFHADSYSRTLASNSSYCCFMYKKKERFGQILNFYLIDSGSSIQRVAVVRMFSDIGISQKSKLNIISQQHFQKRCIRIDKLIKKVIIAHKNQISFALEVPK